MRPSSFKVGITPANGGKEWFAISPLRMGSPAETCKTLNQISRDRNLGTTYRPATTAEYMASRAVDVRV